MVKAEKLIQYELEISNLPYRQYNKAAEVLLVAKDLLRERDRMIQLAKELLMRAMGEKEALSIVFSRLNSAVVHAAKPPSPYTM